MNLRYFRNAGTVVYGWGSLSHLETVKSRRAILFTGQAAMEKSGFLAKAVTFLEEAGADVLVIKGVPSEPSIEDIEAYLGRVIDHDPDLIVALGGGSVLDGAKALWVFYECPELDRREVYKPYVTQPYPLPRLGSKASLIAIPSTSGTGSESSAVSILVEGQSRVKRVLLSMEVIPKVAIIDPQISSTMPPQLTAHTGFDALAHALEAAVSPWSTDFTEPLALKALKLVFQNLKAACDGQNKKAREKMHYASTIAGLAISNSITGLAHGMDKIGLHFGLSHGLTCGVLLPYTVEFTASEVKGCYVKVAESLGLSGKDDKSLTQALINNLVELGQDIGIPVCFKETGIEEGKYINIIEHVIENVLKSGPTVFSPRVPTKEEIRELYLRAFHGDLSI